MAESHVISALTAKRSELAGLVDHHRKEIDRISEEVKVLDSAIKLFDPAYRTNSIKPKRYQKKNEFFKYGEANRIILDILRESSKPLSTNDIAKTVMARKNIDSSSEKPIQASILTVLHRHKKNGLVDMTGKDGSGGCIWMLG